MKRKLVFATWLMTFFLLLLTGGRTPVWGDSGLTFLAAQSLVDHGTPDVHPGARPDILPGTDGRFYSKYSWVPILGSVPLAWSQSLLQNVKSFPVRAVFANVVPSALGGLVSAAIVAVGGLFGVSAAVSLCVGLLTIFSTPLWNYSRMYYSEAGQAAILIWLLFAAIRAKQAEHPKPWLIFAGVLSGLALNTKLPLLLFVAAFAALYLFQRITREKIKKLLLYGGLGFAPGLSAWFWLNAVRFGRFFEAGYSTERDGSIGFSSRAWPGLYGLLLSSGKSIFLYAPLLILSLAVLRRGRQYFGGAFWPIWGAIMVYMVVVAKWWAWSGDVAWGPRLMVPVLPLLFLPLFLLDISSRRWKWAFITLAGVGIWIQVLGNLVPPMHYSLHVTRLFHGTYYSVNPPYVVRDDMLFPHFVPDFNPIAVHYWFLRSLWMSPAAWLQAYPWRSLHVPAWQPTMDWRLPYLNLWWDGSATANVVALLFLGMVVLCAGWLRRILRTNCTEESPTKP